MVAINTTLQQGQTGLSIVDKTILLLRMEGSNGGTTFTDSSIVNRAITRSGATTSTAQVKTGASSGLFTASSSDYLLAGENYSVECKIKTGDDFTVQGWVYFNSVPTTANYTLISLGGATPVLANDFAIGRRYLGAKDSFVYAGAGGYLIQAAGFGSGSWQHFAVCRYRAASTGTMTIEFWIDGTSVGTYTGVNVGHEFGTTEADGSGKTGIGCYVAPTSGARSEFADCYLDEIHVINGVARYRDGATFTPPAFEL